MPHRFVFKNIVKGEDAADLNLSHWSLPVVGENVKKIQTVEEIQENIKKLENEAYDKGYSSGMEKGIEEGREQAFAMTKVDIDNQIAKMDDLLKCFHDPISQLAGEIEVKIIEIIKTLFKNFLEKEIELDEELIISIINEALTELPISNDKKYIYMNPKDKAFIDGISSEYKTEWSERYGQLIIDSDSNLKRGEVFIKTAESTIDGTVETRIQNLLNAEED